LKRTIAIVCFSLVASCAALDGALGAPVEKTDPVTGEVTTTTLGESIADNAETVGNTAGSIVTMGTGNPMLGGLVAAIAASLAAAAAAKRKKAAA
jgi:hypothetical protein